MISSKTDLGRDVDSIIVQYCDAKSLCNLTLLRKKKKSEEAEDDILEPVWKSLVYKRFRARGNILRAVGVQTWKLAYQTMSFRHKIPKGIYTEKHNTIFTFPSSASGCESWVLLGHRANTSLRRNAILSDAVDNFIELRVCVQNICNGMISIPLDNKRFEMWSRTEGDQSLQRLFVKSVTNLGVNGLRKDLSIPDDCDIKLRPYESAVISIKIRCPLEMEFETDFLARADSLSMNIDICKSFSPFLPIKTAVLKLEFVDEETVWDSYVELPGRVILLRSDCGGDSNL